MRVMLVSPFLQPTGIGLRTLSSYVKSRGHDTKCVFLSDFDSYLKTGVDFYNDYPEKVADQLAELCNDCDLVGFTLMTNYFYKVKRLTALLKERISLPVIWGGIHPTICPDECLEEADYVCVGEGEEALVELLENLGEDNESDHDIPNIWLKRDGEIIRNCLRPPIENLDTIPPPDYSLEDKYVLIGKDIVLFNETMLKGLFAITASYGENDKIAYEIMSTRGCPHHCSFCINGYLLDLYSENRFFRKRSIEHLVNELKEIMERFPWINSIIFTDDCFAARTLDELEHFSREYRDKINVPFFCLLSSAYMDKKRIKPLLDAGLVSVEIGIQSASTRMNQIYERDFFKWEQLFERARELNRFSEGKLLTIYDIILDNPYDDIDSLLETLHLVMKLPAPKILNLFSMTLFPGTKLLKMALEDGLVSSARVDYRKQDNQKNKRYINLLFSLVNRGLPNRMIRILAWKPLVRLMETRLFRSFFSLLSPLYDRLLVPLFRKKYVKRYNFVLDQLKKGEYSEG